jgi:hypothetical protein
MYTIYQINEVKQNTESNEPNKAEGRKKRVIAHYCFVADLFKT